LEFFSFDGCSNRPDPKTLIEFFQTLEKIDAASTYGKAEDGGKRKKGPTDKEQFDMFLARLRTSVEKV